MVCGLGSTTSSWCMYSSLPSGPLMAGQNIGRRDPMVIRWNEWIYVIPAHHTGRHSFLIEWINPRTRVQFLVGRRNNKCNGDHRVWRLWTYMHGSNIRHTPGSNTGNKFVQYIIKVHCYKFVYIAVYCRTRSCASGWCSEPARSASLPFLAITF